MNGEGSFNPFPLMRADKAKQGEGPMHDDELITISATREEWQTALKSLDFYKEHMLRGHSDQAEADRAGNSYHSISNGIIAATYQETS